MAGEVKKPAVPAPPSFSRLPNSRTAAVNSAWVVSVLRMTVKPALSNAVAIARASLTGFSSGPET